MDDITKKRVSGDLEAVGAAVGEFAHQIGGDLDGRLSNAMPEHFAKMGLGPGRLGDVLSQLPNLMVMAMRAHFTKDGVLQVLQEFLAEKAVRHSLPYVAVLSGHKPNADVTSADGESGELYLAIGRFYRHLKAEILELDVTLRHDDPSLPFDDHTCPQAFAIFIEMFTMMWDPLAPGVAALVGNNCPDCGEPTQPS